MKGVYMKFKDLTGMNFGYLTALEKDNNPSNKRIHWICQCKCGNKTVVASHQLVSGKTKSCGCKNYESKNIKHGKSNTRIYSIWCDIKARCFNPNEPSYNRYGAKGITMCNEWKDDFMSFYDWSMKNGYKGNLTIDRIDNKMGYQPNNCRWVTFIDQQRNRTNNSTVDLNGKTITLSELSKITGIPYYSLFNRKKSAIKHKGTFTIDDLLCGKDYKLRYNGKSFTKEYRPDKLVDMFSKDGTFIKTIKLKDANELGFNRKAINNCLSGRSKTSGGYIWKLSK